MHTLVHRSVDSSSWKAACFGVTDTALNHELLKFSPSPQHVILSNAKDLLLRRRKQILHFVQDDI